MEGTHKNLIVWRESLECVKSICRLCSTFPQSETYDLSDQMRRSVISIPSNIPEGYGRGSNKEILHFLNIALGSATELETQVIIAYELGFLDDEDYVA